MMEPMTQLCLGTLVLAAGCGSPPPPEEETAAPMPPADTGAGTILRVDPAFDALVPLYATIEKLAGGFMFTEGPVWVRRRVGVQFGRHASGHHPAGRGAGQRRLGRRRQHALHDRTHRLV